MFASFHRKLLTSTAATFATVLIAFAEGPPDEIIRALSAEAYPERVVAEKKLQAWAESGGEDARSWLLNEGRKSEEPEVRRRSLAVLKSVVIQELTRQRPGFLGVAMDSVELADGGGYGAEISTVNEDTPAARAGLQVNDILVSIDGEGCTEPEARNEFAERIGAKRAGDKLRLGILRAGKKQEIEVELAPRPWSLGLYSDRLRFQAERLRFQADPFAAPNPNQGILPSMEEEAAEEAFRSWQEEHLSP